MRHVTLFLASWLIAFAVSDADAQAISVQVRAGEHADYTRLILHIPEQTHWQLTRDSVSAQLDLFGPELEFDLTQTFSRIPRTRLRDIRSVEGGLQLFTGCDCLIEAREDVPQFLIIDIIGAGSHAVYAPLTAPRPPGRPGQKQEVETHASGTPRRAGAQLALALRGGRLDTPIPQSLTLTGILGAAQTERQAVTQDHLDLKESQPVHIAQELGRVLAVSVSTGVLQTTKEFTPATASDPSNPSRMDRNDPDAHLAVITLDRSATSARVAQLPNCPDADLFELPSWNISTDLQEAPNPLQNLFSALDQTDDSQVIAFSKYLLHQGFGAEARMVMSLLSIPDEATDILQGISYVVDLSEVPATIDLSYLQDCGPMGSLWAFLGQPNQELAADFPSHDLVQALQTLPPHLRLHLGPTVIQRLARTGLLEEARVIRAALDRVSHEEQPHLNLARTKLDLLDAEPEKARVLEKKLAPETSDDDLLFLLSRRVERESRSEASLLEAAMTRLFALRGTVTGRQIAGLLIQAMVLEGEFGQAFGILDSSNTGLDQATEFTLRIEIFAALALHADDTDFVMLVFEQRPWELAYLPAPVVQQLASRLRNLGFDLQADLLDKHAVEDRQDDTQALRRADMAIQEETKAASLVEVSGSDRSDIPVSSPEADTGQVQSDQALAPEFHSDLSQQETDAQRARAAQAQRRAQDNLALSALPDPGAQASETEVADAPLEQDVDEGARGIDSNQISATQTVAPPASETAPTGPAPDSALLSHSRDALQQSAELRERLRSLLGPEAQP